MIALMPQELHQLLDRSIQDTTHCFGGIQLVAECTTLSEDTCTVHTLLEGGHRAAILLHADTPLLVRMARNILGSDIVTPRDIQDVATEYFNVLCGRIVSGLFRAAHISSRFHVPRFEPGCYQPEEEPVCRLVRSYSGGGSNESIQLIYMGLPPVGPADAV